jgi:hypothetical protein
MALMLSIKAADRGYNYRTTGENSADLSNRQSEGHIGQDLVSLSTNIPLMSMLDCGVTSVVG